MSSESKLPALNLYGILDNELARMHGLIHAFITVDQQSSVSHHNHNSYGPGGSPSAHTYDCAELYKRIVAMQDLLLHSVISHDKVLQERVAELALTGVKDET